ncbi:molybdate transport system ATP-binding protein [Georgenia soli]|uniref:Molybdate transport system ATP-binding protein n=1 Tax=Georgenia soli TaxID=638953 RepID=A0A2A9EM52_9MICO|nr:ATP-binding cassette domain-containing protein [Georgenia soli]PFG39332.1 molybdate transport system ATP-binding protein [Georgenia soli]
MSGHRAARRGPAAAAGAAGAAGAPGTAGGAGGADAAATPATIHPPALAVRAGVPERDVELDVEVPAGEVVAVLGPNGAGKSTLLALAAGTLRPGAGTVSVGGRTVADGATWVPPHARRVALLAQEPLLFPHLDALGNVAFGPRAAGAPRREAARVAHDLLDRVGAGDLAHRRPAELSGGQAQRVALARALAPDPEVVLLDEPLSALDVGSAAEVRQVLRRVLREAGRAAVLVTHDLLDVLAVADSVVVLEAGRVVERGPALQVLTRPRSAFAARLAGVNLVAGSLAGTGGEAVVEADGGLELHGLPDPACEPGSAVAAAFSPRAVSVHRAPPGGSPRNTVPVTVEALEHQGELVRVRGAGPGGHRLAADITPASVAGLDLTPGAAVLFTVKTAEVAIYPA